jgi:hypothetical protein
MALVPKDWPDGSPCVWLCHHCFGAGNLRERNSHHVCVQRSLLERIRRSSGARVPKGVCSKLMSFSLLLLLLLLLLLFSHDQYSTRRLPRISIGTVKQRFNGRRQGRPRLIEPIVKEDAIRPAYLPAFSSFTDSIRSITRKPEYRKTYINRSLERGGYRYSKSNKGSSEWAEGCKCVITLVFDPQECISMQNQSDTVDMIPVSSISYCCSRCWAKMMLHH